MRSKVDKRLVAKRFSLRADQYEQATPVQEKMADHLMDLARKACRDISVRRIVELGCGTGRLTKRLIDAYPQAELLVIDIAEDMVAYTKERFPGIDLLTADAEECADQINGGVDLIISNATIQWFTHPHESIPAWRAKLSNHGAMVLSTFGPQTFCELRASFESAYQELDIDHQEHLLNLRDIQSWKAISSQATIEEHVEHPTFPTVRDFLRSIQQAGATNALNQGIKPSRRVFSRMSNHYRDDFTTDDGTIAATYHILYLIETL